MTDALHAGTVLLQGAIAATLVVGLRRRDPSVVANAIVSLVAAFMPAIAEAVLWTTLEVDVTFDTVLSLWVAAAGFLHMLGMLGWYDTVWWWDHVTHTVSAALVAAVVYAGVVTVESHTAGFRLSRGGLIGVTFLFTMAGGVFWELLEVVARDVSRRFGVEPVLKHYGKYDTPLDLVFDGVGALVVAAFDVRVFVPVFGQVPQFTKSLLVASTALVVGGSIVMGVFLGYTRGLAWSSG